MDDIIDYNISATEAWNQMSNEMLVYWTDAYLKHSLQEEKNGWYVYRKRWRKYVKEKKHPHYDTVRLFHWKQHTAVCNKMLVSEITLLREQLKHQ